MKKRNGDAPEATAAEDMAVLFPDVDVAVRDPDSGERVPLTVREFRFLEGLQISAAVRPLIESIGAAVSEDETEIDIGMIHEAMTEHANIWVECTARATGRDAEWIGRLSDGDGQALSAAMWSANGSFFGRRLVEAVKRRQKAGPSHLPKSSMPSSGPDTGGDTATSPSG